MTSLPYGLSIAAAVFALSACSDSSETEIEDTQQMTPFSLNFAAQNGDQPVTCDSILSGFGSEGHYSVSVSDLRFYVSNIQLFNLDGELISATYTDNDFQLNHEAGFVGLIDLTSNSDGACQDDAIAYSEGTARTNNVISGEMIDTGLTKITFDIGVPQAVMKSVISATSAEDAPSPLNEMYWSWASGYRHFVMNFAIENMAGTTGEGYIHIGSRGCGDDAILALENKDSCDLVNTPKVELNNIDINNQTVTLDLSKVLQNLAFKAEMSGGHGNHSSNEMIMNAPSVTCHSASVEAQPDCGPIFANFGLNTEDGSAASAANETVVLK